MHCNRCGLWAAWVLLLATLGAGQAPTYAPSTINRTCKYAATNISAALFYNGTAGLGGEGNTTLYLFPADHFNRARQTWEEPWRACWSSKEEVDMGRMLGRDRLPCYYQDHGNGTVSYWEEAACDGVIKANCYCYSVGRDVGSYCSPAGMDGPVDDCTAPAAGTIADGGVPVDRATVYGTTPVSGHYVALMVFPAASDALGYGDFHYTRLDAGGTWSYKAGDTLVRAMLRNGTAITDVEEPAVRGAYTEFCGYFLVNPATHNLTGNGYWPSELPSRLLLWGLAAGISHTVDPLTDISYGWLALNRQYFWSNGWQDHAARPQEAPSGREGAFVPSNGAIAPVDLTEQPPPHWRSVAPPPARSA